MNCGDRDPCSSAVLLCSEFKAEINAGMVIVTSCKVPRPHAPEDEPFVMTQRLLQSRVDYVKNLSESKDSVAAAASSGLLWAPLVSAQATKPVHWTHAWALLGEWAGHIAFPLPERDDTGKYRWPKHGHAGCMDRQFVSRMPSFINWGRPASNRVHLRLLFFCKLIFLCRCYLVTNFSKAGMSGSTTCCLPLCTPLGLPK